MRLAFWRRPTIDEHLAPITKIVCGLQSHVEHFAAQERLHRQRIVEHDIQAGLSKIEADRALTQINNINGVFGS